MWNIYIYNILMVQVLGLKTMDHIFFRYLMFHIFLKLAVLVISGFSWLSQAFFFLWRYLIYSEPVQAIMFFYLLVALNGHCVRWMFQPGFDGLKSWTCKIISIGTLVGNGGLSKAIQVLTWCMSALVIIIFYSHNAFWLTLWEEESIYLKYEIHSLTSLSNSLANRPCR